MIMTNDNIHTKYGTTCMALSGLRTVESEQYLLFLGTICVLLFTLVRLANPEQLQFE